MKHSGSQQGCCQRTWFTGILLLSVMWLNGCSSTPAPVEKPSEQPSSVRITLLAEPDINHNEDGEPAPVEMNLVYLSEDSRFLAADDEQLESGKLEKSLGKNYIDHQDYTLLPGQYKPLEVLTLEKKSRYIGVVVHYANANQSEWKKIIRVKDIGRHYNILVHVRNNDVEFRKEEEE